MRELGKQVETMHQSLANESSQDLDAATMAARRGAELVQLGYGKFEDKGIDGFARMARDSEAWFLEIATEAGQGRGSIARQLLQQSEVHCVRCHDAADQ